MATNFPDTPSVGDTHVVDGRTWVWNGVTWDFVGSTASIGPTGPSGPTGPAGKFTASATQPDTSTSVNGDAWFNTQNAKTYVFNNGAFIEVASGNVGPAGPAGASRSFGISASWWLGV